MRRSGSAWQNAGSPTPPTRGSAQISALATANKLNATNIISTMPNANYELLGSQETGRHHSPTEDDRLHVSLRPLPTATVLSDDFASRSSTPTIRTGHPSNLLGMLRQCLRFLDVWLPISRSAHLVKLTQLIGYLEPGRLRTSEQMNFRP